MKILIICQGPAYGDERSYNGLRLAVAVSKRDDTEVRVFLIGDAVTCAVAGQQVPDGYYHLGRMVTAAGHHDTDVGCCSTCLDARAITDAQLTAPAHRATLEDLADWVLWADKSVTF
jgi:uncharacterized protein involved in oxidation of intracellular sulfur